jgi:hypothetical protein
VRILISCVLPDQPGRIMRQFLVGRKRAFDCFFTEFVRLLIQRAFRMSNGLNQERTECRNDLKLNLLGAIP